MVVQGYARGARADQIGQLTKYPVLLNHIGGLEAKARTVDHLPPGQNNPAFSDRFVETEATSSSASAASSCISAEG